MDESLFLSANMSSATFALQAMAFRASVASEPESGAEEEG